MNIKQNKLGAYLAVTAGAGCAASVAEGAVQVVDLSGLSTSNGTSTFPGSTGDADPDFAMNDGAPGYGYLRSDVGHSGMFYSDVPGVNGMADWARGYQSGASFPADPDLYALWVGNGNVNGGFIVGLNWVALKDSAGNYGWMSFTLSGLSDNGSLPISSFGSFVYDDTSTGSANAMDLDAAIAAVPEPSGLALLALGSAGLAARRKRKKAA